MKNYHGIPLLVLAAAVSEATYGAVTAVNDGEQPGEEITVAQGRSVVINVLANDSATSGSLSVYPEFGSPFYGSIVLNNDNTFTYTPAPGYVGPDSFDYTAVDDDGLSYGGEATVFIEVLEASTGGEEGPIESTVVGESNKATAAMLDSYCSAPSEELRTACTELEGLLQSDPEALNDLVSQITPEEILMQRRMMSETVRSQAGRLYSSQQLLRNGAGVGRIGANTLLLNSYVGSAAGAEEQRWAVFGSVKFGETEHDRTSVWRFHKCGLPIIFKSTLRAPMCVGESNQRVSTSRTTVDHWPLSSPLSLHPMRRSVFLHIP